MPNERLVFDNKVLRIDKGRTAPPSEDEGEPRGSQDEHIPWGYGRDRLTAMAVDPNRLYLYWELTDPAVEKARQGLGSGQKDSWVNLRIYDVTGRIFDGTNAHGYFDIKVDRSDRQWFAHIGKPASTHVVEIGLKSIEGYFVKIVRSGRVDFPRFEPSPDGTVEWLTVRTSTGPVDGGVPGASSSNSSSHGGAGASSSLTNGAGDTDLARSETNGHASVTFDAWSWSGWEQIFHSTWHEVLRTHGGQDMPLLDGSSMIQTSWESGALALPTELPRACEEYQQGPVTVVALDNGKTRIVYGPWQLTVRGIGGHAEKRVIARWEVAASWIVEMGFERVVHSLSLPHSEGGAPVRGTAPLKPGIWEWVGASERRWLGASDLRFFGASEIHRIGASELRMRGASELLVGSERRLGGASETLLRGASELRLGEREGVYAYPAPSANPTWEQR